MSAEQLLGSVESTDRVVVADFEAGIGTLTRMVPGTVDVVLIVVEPTPKSIEVGVRAAGLVRNKQLGRVVIVANRVRGDDDLDLVRRALPDVEVVAVPDDDAIVAADRDGVAPLDLAPDAPAVAALRDLATEVAASPRAPVSATS